MKSPRLSFLPKNIIVFLILISLMCFASLAHAQADRIGSGGNWTEADLKHFLSRLSTYLESKEGLDVFPEVTEYNRQHPKETIENIAFELSPKIVNHAVFDSGKNERDCVSYQKPTRYFECNIGKLPPKPDDLASVEQKSQSYGSLYRLVLHELLVQSGIEQPISVEVPSSYAVSSRLLVHLESFPEWVPGSSKFKFSIHTNVDFHPELEPSLGLSFAYIGNIYHYGLTTKLLVPVTISEGEFKVGLVSGFYQGITEPDFSGDFWMVPVLLSAEYEFNSSASVKPYLGISSGLSFRHGYYKTLVSNYSLVPGNIDTVSDFMVAITPGINFGHRQALFFEISLGHEADIYSAIATFGVRF